MKFSKLNYVSDNYQDLYVLVSMSEGDNTTVAKRVYVPFHSSCTVLGYRVASLGSNSGNTLVTVRFAPSNTYLAGGTIKMVRM